MGPHTQRIKEVFVNVNSYEHSRLSQNCRFQFASSFREIKSVLGLAEFSSRTSMEQGCEGSKIELCVVSTTRWKRLGEKASGEARKQTSAVV